MIGKLKRRTPVTGQSGCSQTEVARVPDDWETEAADSGDSWESLQTDRERAGVPDDQEMDSSESLQADRGSQ